MSTNDATDEEPEDLTGTILGAEYRIERKLGMGGMSHVYLAHQISVDRPVVVKVMIPPSVDVERWKGRFMREARAASKIRHGGVVTIYSFGEEEGVGPYIAMEYVEGRSLREVIEEEAPLDPHRAISLVAQACRALHAAHQFGVVHRDLKPDNLMIEVEDGRERARVLDFGVAKAPDTLVQTLDGHVVGTPAYMAPEQARDQEVDGRTDVYSMGIILHELLTGDRPFRAPTAVALMLKHVQEPFPAEDIDAPEPIVEAMEKACAKAPDERWETAKAFAEALESIERPRETPSDLGALNTDDLEVRPTTPMPSVALGDATPGDATPGVSNPGVSNPGVSNPDGFGSSQTRIAAEPAADAATNRNAKLALGVSLGALLLAVVAVAFFVTSLDDDAAEAPDGSDEGEMAIEIIESGSDDLERGESPAVSRAKVAIFESRTVARGATEKAADPSNQTGGESVEVSGDSDQKLEKESNDAKTRSESTRAEDDFQLLEAPTKKKDLVDPFQ